MPSPEIGSPAYRASDGAAYDWFLGRWTRRLAEPFIDFADLSADGCVLEVGCGTGSLAGCLAARRPGCTVVGIDLSQPYLVQARVNAAGSLYAAGDAQRLAFRSGVFAGALAQLVLNFVPDTAAAIAEMKRVTRAGGDRCRVGLGLSRRPGLPAPLLGHRRWHRSRGR